MSLGIYLTSWLLLGFLIGSIPFGWIVTRLRGVDIRKVGSGNIGMTNVWRALGWQYGLAVLVLDALKGLVPILALYPCLPHSPAAGNAGLSALIAMLTGLAAVLGHTFTPWLKFRGGKGVATAFGVLIAIFQLWVLVPLAVFVVLATITRYVSVGSLVAATVVVVISFAVPDLRLYWPLGLLAGLLIFWTHRENIQRLRNGSENRFGAKKPQPCIPEKQTD